MTLPDDIERAALIGWHMYPASHKSKHACFKNATNQATADLNQLARWAREFPRCNWRVVCGPSGIWGLDLDTPPIHMHDGIATMADLTKIHGSLPKRPTLRSGGGGLGIFFRHNGERITGKSGEPYSGIDPRRGRLSQTIPPSIHITTGKPYRWLDAPWDTAPPEAPQWLVNLFSEPPEPEWKHAPIDTTDAARTKLYRAVQVIAQSGSGGRNDTLNRRSFQIGCMIGAGLLGEQEAIEALYGAARMAGLDHVEAKATIRSGVNSGIRRGCSVG